MVVYNSEKINDPEILNKINNILEPLRDIGLSEDKKLEFYTLIDKIIKNLDEEKSSEFRDYVYLSNEIIEALNIIFDDKSTRLLVKNLIEINIFNKKLNLAYESKIDSLNDKLTEYKDCNDLLTKNLNLYNNDVVKKINNFMNYKLQNKIKKLPKNIENLKIHRFILH